MRKVSKAAPAAELTPELTAAMARTQEASAECGRVRRALDKARRDLAGAERELAGVRARLAAAEASSALKDGHADADVRQEFTKVRDNVEFLRARVVGLEDALRERQQVANDARAGLDVARRAWVNSRTEGALKAYEASLEVFLTSVSRLAAAGAALGSGRLLAISKGLFLPSPSDAHKDLANPKRLNWRADQAAVDVYDRLVAVRSQFDGLLSDSVNDQLESGDAAA